MAINFDVNEGMKNKTSRVIIIALLVLIAILYLFLGLNGNHNKMPGLETNIPLEKVDTAKSSVSIGEVNGDFVNGNKTVNNNLIDTTKKK